MSESSFQKLRVWKMSKNLAVEIYKLCHKQELLSRDYRFRSQICASAVSIPSNISEGEELNTIKQSLRYLYIAKGSNAELKTQLIIANEIGFIDDGQFNELSQKVDIISKMLFKLIESKEKSIQVR